MNNLKRVLSLGLTGAMLTGMMFVGAADFSDAEDIKHDEAVNTMAALNVLNGKDDGSFDPTATVTRAEMAKIITVMRNGGETPNIGVKPQASFTDIKGHWAESYIEYCYNLGIINGRGDGTFDPAGTVTGSEAAKMLLTALGYDSTVYGFTGIDWELNTNRIANTKDAKLYEDLKGIDPSADLSRDNAAQMAFNTLNARIMDKTISNVVNSGEISYTYKLTDPFFVEYFEGQIAYATMDNISYNSDKEEYTYGLAGAEDENGDDAKLTSVDSTVDYSDLFGMAVKVLYDAKENVYGIYAQGTVLAEGTKGALKIADDKKSVKLDGTKYTLEKDADATKLPVWAYNQAAAENNLDAVWAEKDENATAAYEKIALIDNDNNGKVDLVIKYPVIAAQVNTVGKTVVSVTDLRGAKITFKYDKDNDVYTCEAAEGFFGEGAKFSIDEVAEDDFVFLTKDHVNDGPFVAEHIDTLEGKVEGTKEGQLKIDGEWYDALFEAAKAKVGTKGTFYTLNGYIVGVDGTSKAKTTDVVMIAAQTSNTDFDKNVQTKLIFTDGTTKVVYAKLAEGEFTEDVADNTLYTYEVKDGVYTLTKAATDTKETDGNVDYEETLGADLSYEFGEATKLSDDETRIADDAVVFVRYETSDTAPYGKVKVITGAELKTWDAPTVVGGKLTAEVNGFYNDVKGFATAKLMTLNLANAKLAGTVGDGSYGYIVSDPYLGEDADENAATYFDLWNGEEVVSVYAKGDVKVAKNTVISFTDKGDGLVALNDKETFNALAITAYDGKYVKFESDTYKAEYEITDKTTIIYIDSDAKEGIEAGKIMVADKNEAEDAKTDYNANVWALLDEAEGKEKVSVLFVDVNNALVVNK